MTTETVRLYGWTTFEDGQRPIRALLFGEMVRRATPLMHQFQSDLFHDAVWLEDRLLGEQSFDWLVRPSGTNLSDEPDPAKNMAHIGVGIGPGDTAVFYRVRLWCDKGNYPARPEGYWCADFTSVPLDAVKAGYLSAYRASRLTYTRH